MDKDCFFELSQKSSVYLFFLLCLLRMKALFLRYSYINKERLPSRATLCGCGIQPRKHRSERSKAHNLYLSGYGGMPTAFWVAGRKREGVG